MSVAEREWLGVAERSGDEEGVGSVTETGVGEGVVVAKNSMDSSRLMVTSQKRVAHTNTNNKNATKQTLARGVFCPLAVASKSCCFTLKTPVR